jgi:tetratricopeptide (TPR) repeat protein
MFFKGRSKLSEAVNSDARRRFPPALLLYRFLPILLNFALFGCVASAVAQTSGTEQVDWIISGTVFLPQNNQPASQVAVSLKSHEAGIFRSVLTDYDGRFEVRGLVPGEYEVRVEEAGYETLRTKVQLDGPSMKVELHLISSQSSQSLRTAYTVSVRELKIPDRAKSEYRKGLESMAKKDFAASLSHFTKAVQVFPDFYEALYHQGVVETSLGRFENAMQSFQESIDLSGGQYAWADFGVGYVLYLKGRAAEAEAIIRRGLELDQNSADGFLLLGLTLLRLNRSEEAEKSAREALARRPDFAEAYLVVADANASRQNYREQIQGLDTYLRLEPAGAASQHVHKVRQLALSLLANAHPQN